MRELLESGVHYGHHTSRWNPKMKRYIYKARHSIHVVDLRETVRGLVRATRFLSGMAEQGAQFILVGTKKQARQTVVDEATRGELHYVSERWLGGMLTNFRVVMSRVKRLHELEDMDASGEIEAKGKKYASVLRREMAKLQKNLNGVREMKRTPDVMIIVDPRRERNALREAINLDIPTICFLDTDSDPDEIDIVIPGNDDAMRSVQLICSKLVDSIIEGRARMPVAPEVEAEIAIPVAEAAAPADAPEAAAEAAPAAAAAAPVAEAAEAAPAAEASSFAAIWNSVKSFCCLFDICFDIGDGVLIGRRLGHLKLHRFHKRRLTYWRRATKEAGDFIAAE